MKSSIVIKSELNCKDLDNKFKNSLTKNKSLVREQIISLIRKYNMEKVIIYLLVDKPFDFILP
jgi:hypothetical protein